MNPNFARHQKLPGIDAQRLSALPRSERRSPDRLEAGLTSKLADREIGAPIHGENRTFLPQIEGTQQPASSQT